MSSPSTAWVLVPIKDPLLAKTRLAPVLTASQRALLQRAMLADVIATLRRSRLVNGVAVIGPDNVRNSISSTSEFVRDDRTKGDLNRSIALGAHELTKRGADIIAVIPGDVPLIEPGEIDIALEQVSRTGSTIVVPDRHRKGTNALVFAASSPPEFAFGPGSLKRHLGSPSAPTRMILPLASLELDIDTPEDLQLFAAHEGKICASATNQVVATFVASEPVRETYR